MHKTSWTETVERYLREGRSVSGGCGPSSGLKALNTTVTGILNTAKSEASTIFGDASSVFQNIVGGLQQIVNGGPSQAGFSAAELNAKNAAAVQGGAVMARNLAGAAGASAAAVGGGNTATPGAIMSAELGAKTAAAAETAGAENEIVQQNYATGNKNYWSAIGSEEALPNVFNPAISAEGETNKAASTALQTQKEMDTQSNWWQPMVTAAIGGAARGLTGGLLGGIGGGTPGAPVSETATTDIGTPTQIPTTVDTSYQGATIPFPTA